MMLIHLRLWLGRRSGEEGAERGPAADGAVADVPAADGTGMVLSSGPPMGAVAGRSGRGPSDDVEVMPTTLTGSALGVHSCCLPNTCRMRAPRGGAGTPEVVRARPGVRWDQPDSKTGMGTSAPATGDE